jgi:hypothetical protein
MNKMPKIAQMALAVQKHRRRRVKIFTLQAFYFKLF